MKQVFDWNIAKAASNLKKHGVSFEAARLVFADPLKLDEIDEDERNEIRWRTIGKIMGDLIVLVVHTDREKGGVEVIRLISARPATTKERQRYEQNRISKLY